MEVARSSETVQRVFSETRSLMATILSPRQARQVLTNGAYDSDLLLSKYHLLSSSLLLRRHRPTPGRDRTPHTLQNFRPSDDLCALPRRLSAPAFRPDTLLILVLSFSCSSLRRRRSLGLGPIERRGAEASGTCPERLKRRLARRRAPEAA